MTKVFFGILLSLSLSSFAKSGAWIDAIDPRDYTCSEIQQIVEDEGSVRFCSGWLGCKKVLREDRIKPGAWSDYSLIAWPTLDKTFCEVGWAKHKAK